MSDTWNIQAEWDQEAGVFVATSEDIPGLVAEAPSLYALVPKLRPIIYDLVELNNIPIPHSHMKIAIHAEVLADLDLTA